MDHFLGKWSFHSSDKFDEYLAALGVGFMLRKMAGTAKPDLFFTQEGDSFTMKSVSTVKTSVVTFKLGEEVPDKTPDGREVKNVFTMEGNRKLTQDQKSSDPSKSSVIVREISEDGQTMTMTLTAGSVVCTRVYKKAQK